MLKGTKIPVYSVLLINKLGFFLLWQASSINISSQSLLGMQYRLGQVSMCHPLLGSLFAATN